MSRTGELSAVAFRGFVPPRRQGLQAKTGELGSYSHTQRKI
jgi:hypothetical protein